MSTVKNDSGLTSMSHGLLDGCDEICGDSAGSGAHDHGHHLFNLLLVSNLLNFFFADSPMELSPTRQITDSQITDRARVLDQLTD